jgi:ArsR family transcriptional regulator
MVKHYRLEMLFRALADRTRLRLLNLMGGSEVCVCYFVEILRTNQPKVSRHLAYMRKAGIVAARREGKWMHYRIVQPPDPHAAHILNEVLSSFIDDAEMRRDRERLASVCCAPRQPVRLVGAPVPLLGAATQLRPERPAHRAG